MNVDPGIDQQVFGVIRYQIDVMNYYIEFIRQRQIRRRRRRRGEWVRPWISRRPALGVYDQLLVELRAEDPAAFLNFLRMPPPMFDELLERLSP